MKKLKNINYWITELRKIAYETDLIFVDDDENHLINKTQKKELFSKARFEDAFNDGMSPKEAFESEMQIWADSL